MTNEDTRTRKAALVLERLAANWHESADHLATVTLDAKAKLNKEGVAETALALAEGIDSHRTLPFANYTYVEHTAMYAILRRNGRTHAMAIAQLPQAMIDLASRELTGTR